MIARRALGLLAALLAALYSRSPVYDFPPPTVFSGSAFLNPYGGEAAPWQRANFHAHGRAWYGITNGAQSPSEIVEAYRKLGYSVAGISNYQRIAAHDGVDTFPAYEHGYNFAKRHQLAIGARSVEWFDFPLWQSPSDEQFIIDRVRAKADLVALAHPSSNSYSLEDLSKLTGYELLEVVNGPFVMEDAWDAALSSGHLVWGIADDDSHDLNDVRRVGVAWNMIGAATSSSADIVDALRSGRVYAVMKTDENPAPVEASVPEVAFNDRTLMVSAGEPSAFLFIGQNGVVRGSTKYAMQASYTFTANDTYIRAVVRSARTATFVNPIIRYDGYHVPARTRTVNVTETWLRRAGCLAAAGAFLFLSLVASRKSLKSEV